MRREPLEAPEVGHDGHLGLADREQGVGTGQPDVAGGDEVDTAADAVPVDGGDDRHRAVGHRGDRGLEAQDLGPGRPGAGGHARAARRLPRSGGPADVRPWPPGPDRPRSGGPGPRRPRPGRPGRRRWRAMARGRSAQKAGPMALRFSGRSSQRVATWPSHLDGQDLGGEGVDAVGGGHGTERRPRSGAAQGRVAARAPVGPGTVSGPGRMVREARGPGLFRERLLFCPPSPPTSPPHCPVRPGCSDRRAAAAEAFSSSPLPTREGRGLAVQPDRPARPRPVPAGRHRADGPDRRARAVALRTGSTPWWTASGRARASW